jgi:hypothetical protein
MPVTPIQPCYFLPERTVGATRGVTVFENLRSALQRLQTPMLSRPSGAGTIQW